MGLATVIAKMGRFEEDMREYEAVLRERGYTPTIWPVTGTLEGGFGGRRNPFGVGYEFHSGQDIEADWGAPVISGASGRVTFVGWQNGYGQLVVVDHGGGLTTRYAHFRTSTSSWTRRSRGVNWWAKWVLRAVRLAHTCTMKCG